MALAETAGLLDWVLNGTQVGAKVMMLRKTWWAPIFGLAVQVFPIIYAYYNDQWGFLITPLVMGPIYALSIRKWSTERYEHEYVESHMKEYVVEEHMKHPDWARNLLAQYGDEEEREKYGGDLP
jgi:hypothetical protein